MLAFIFPGISSALPVLERFALYGVWAPGSTSSACLALSLARLSVSLAGFLLPARLIFSGRLRHDLGDGLLFPAG